MSIRHVIQSLLVRQSMALGNGWDAKYPNDWLIWEAGAGKSGLAEANVLTTQVPEFRSPAKAPEGDSLCFELPASSGQVRVGRGFQNDIVIPDATVSREHLMLERVGETWVGQALASSRATKFSVRSGPVTEDLPVPLHSGDRITLGSVTLTFLSAAALKARVQSEAARLSKG